MLADIVSGSTNISHSVPKLLTVDMDRPTLSPSAELNHCRCGPHRDLAPGPDNLAQARVTLPGPHRPYEDEEEART